MAMMRSYMRAKVTQQPFDVSKLERLNLTESQLNDMYRLLELPNMKIVLLFQLRTKKHI